MRTIALKKSEGWDLKKLKKIKTSHFEFKDTDWIFELLGWKHKK